MKHLLTRLSLPPLVLEPGTVFTFGRDATNKLSIPVNKVSRQHAEIRWKDDKPVVFDLASANGTFVSGRRVTEHPLAEGDELQIGPFVAMYHFGDPVEIQAQQMRTTNRMSRTTGDRPAPLMGAIEGAGLGEFLQSLEFNQKTGTLNVYDRGAFCWVTVQEGVPFAAEAAGKLDLDAVFHILSIQGGEFVFEPDLKTPDKRMTTSITGLLLEWSRRQDTAGQGDHPTAIG